MGHDTTRRAGKLSTWLSLMTPSCLAAGRRGARQHGARAPDTLTTVEALVGVLRRARATPADTSRTRPSSRPSGRSGAGRCASCSPPIGTAAVELVNGMLAEARGGAPAGAARPPRLAHPRDRRRGAAGRADHGRDGDGDDRRDPRRRARPGSAVCAADDCEGLVLDLSRNRSRRYCSTACGNRKAVAAYRARQRG